MDIILIAFYFEEVKLSDLSFAFNFISAPPCPSQNYTYLKISLEIILERNKR